MDRQLFAFKSLVGSLIGDAKCLSSCIQLLTRQTLLKNATVALDCFGRFIISHLKGAA